MATELSSSLVILEKKFTVELDISSVEQRFSEIMANLEDYYVQLQRLQASGGYRYDELIEIESAIQSEDDSINTLSKPFTKVIKKPGDSRKKWMERLKNEYDRKSVARIP